MRRQGGAGVSQFPRSSPQDSARKRMANVETRYTSPSVTQAGVQWCNHSSLQPQTSRGSSHPPISASQAAGTTGMHHHAWLIRKDCLGLEEVEKGGNSRGGEKSDGCVSSGHCRARPLSSAETALVTPAR
ncbi:hypothetical protein AAY473_000671 [Plecturocebus cupreus]